MVLLVFLALCYFNFKNQFFLNILNVLALCTHFSLRYCQLLKWVVNFKLFQFSVKMTFQVNVQFILLTATAKLFIHILFLVYFAQDFVEIHILMVLIILAVYLFNVNSIIFLNLINIYFFLCQ